MAEPKASAQVDSDLDTIRERIRSGAGDWTGAADRLAELAARVEPLEAELARLQQAAETALEQARQAVDEIKAAVEAEQAAADADYLALVENIVSILASALGAPPAEAEPATEEEAT